MPPESDAQLLAGFAERGDERAFTEIVARHANLVYSAALRQVNSSDLAAEVAQQVFIGLARGAQDLSRRLASDASLAGWLCRNARNLSLNLRRDEFRRHSRERQAMEHPAPTPETAPDWEHLRPVLDEAMSELSEPDYDALVLRFFKNQDLRSVGLALGLSDDAAQKRVARALDKLREQMSRRGIGTATAALSIAISANAVQVAPAGLAATLSTVALAGTTFATAATVTATTMNWINAKPIAALLAAALAAGTGTYLLQQREATRLRNENQSLMAQLSQLADDRETALSATTAFKDELERSRMDKADLLRLRGEVAVLRGQTNELDSLRKENAQLQQRAQAKAVNNQGTNKLPVVAKIIVTRVKQPQLISEEQIRAQILVKVGDIFNRAAVDHDVRNLSGMFHNLRVADSTTDEGVILNYMLQEKPRLTGIRFAGSTQYRDADLNELVASKVGEALDERAIYNEARRLEELYRKSGFPGANVKSVMNINEDVGEGDVVFEIVE